MENSPWEMRWGKTPAGWLAVDPIGCANRVWIGNEFRLSYLSNVAALAQFPDHQATIHNPQSPIRDPQQSQRSSSQRQLELELHCIGHQNKYIIVNIKKKTMRIAPISLAAQATPRDWRICWSMFGGRCCFLFFLIFLSFLGHKPRQIGQLMRGSRVREIHPLISRQPHRPQRRCFGFVVFNTVWQ